MVRWFLVVVIAAASAAPASANPHLDRAKQLEEKLEYAAALDELREAVVYGGNSLEEMVEIYWLTGAVAGGLGDAQTAYNAFRRVIAIEGARTLPTGTSPKIVEPYQQAIDSFAPGESIRAAVELDTGGVVVVIDSDPVGMVAGARAVFSAAGTPTESEADGDSRIALAVPAGADLLSIEVFDKHDNVIAVAQPPAEVEPSRPAPMPRPVAASTPLYARWWLWAGVSGVSAALGVGFGLATSRAQDDLAAARDDAMNVPYDEVESIIERGRRNALLTNISFGVAGVAAAVAVWAFVARGESAGVGVAPATGGAVVAAFGRF